MPANGNPFAKLGVKGQEQLKAPKPCNVRVVNGNISFIPGECGEPAIENNIFFWGFLFTDLIVNVLMTWCGVPLWSIFCRPFTHGLPRFAQCGCNFEPFTSMDDGLPCFRPRKQQWEVLMEDTNARLKSMERLLSAEAHIRRSMRNRFKARLAKLEGSKSVNTASTRRRTDAVVTSEVARRVNAEADALGKENKGGLVNKSSVCIRTWVVQENFHLAEHLLHDIARAMHEESDGFKGMVVVTPGTYRNSRSFRNPSLAMPFQPKVIISHTPFASLLNRFTPTHQLYSTHSLSLPQRTRARSLFNRKSQIK